MKNFNVVMSTPIPSCMERCRPMLEASSKPCRAADFAETEAEKQYWVILSDEPKRYENSFMPFP